MLIERELQCPSRATSTRSIVVAIAPFLGLRQPHWIATLNLLF
jgi:hypothetical protein